jgi:hypothetical protein
VHGEGLGPLRVKPAVAIDQRNTAGEIKMKKLFARATIALGVIAAALVALDGGHALAAARSIAPGDVLTYDLTLDVQLHALGAKSNASMDSVRSGAATESLAISRVLSDGTAYAALTLVYRGTRDGKPAHVNQSWRAELAPDGEIHAVGARASVGDDLEQALAYINGLTKGLPTRTLASGTTWTAKEPLGTSSGSMVITSKVEGVQTYHGYRAYVIQQNGAGAFTQSVNGSPGVGSIAIGGTLYYDGADHILIGAAGRSETEMALTHADIAHISATTTVNVRLRSWRHAPAAAPIAPSAAPASASAAPSAEPNAAQSVAPASTQSPAYTPVPSTSSTPSPISTGN